MKIKKFGEFLRESKDSGKGKVKEYDVVYSIKKGSTITNTKTGTKMTVDSKGKITYTDVDGKEHKFDDPQKVTSPGSNDAMDMVYALKTTLEKDFL